MLNLIPKDARLCGNTYIVDVSPQTAKQWLDYNNFNRPKNTEAVTKYVRQIQEGRWRLTHQGIAFTADGILLDGQHRLFAVAESGVTIPMRVCFNEPANNFTVIDYGKNRSVLDAVRMAMNDGTITAEHIGILRAMLAGRFCRTVNRWSNAELKDKYLIHQTAVNFAAEQFRLCRNRQINDRTVKGVIARAYYHVAKEVLESFCCQLVHGGSNAVSPLNICLNSWRDRTAGTKQEIYRRTELTLEAVIANFEEVDFTKSGTELFPLPQEQ